MANKKVIIENTIGEGRKEQYRLTIKTGPLFWLDTDKPILLPFSIYSTIYDGIDGNCKIIGLLQFVKKNVKGKITVVLCTGAHLNVLSLRYSQDIIRTKSVVYQDAKKLLERYSKEFQGCQVIYWEDFVNKNLNYNLFKSQIKSLFETNKDFHEQVKNDAESLYNYKHPTGDVDKNLYIKLATLYLLEMSIFVYIASKKGYRFEIYPGKRPLTLVFINDNFLEDSAKLAWINIGLSGLKKVIS